MIWAMRDGTRVRATPSTAGTCPGCGGDLLAKCGQIVSWHWAHQASDCDPWHEPESEWHLGWKRNFPESWQEVTIGPHRADVKTPQRVIELQASSLDVDTIRERERFYGNMIWLLRGADFVENLRLRVRGSLESGYLTFRWYWPRKSWWHAMRPIFIDIPEGTRLFGDDDEWILTAPHVLEVRRVHRETPCGGWGYIITHDHFMETVGAIDLARRAVA